MSLWVGVIGWAGFAVCGLGWWIKHRGVAGIMRDLADARSEVEKRKGALKK